MMRTVWLELARCPEFPEGSATHGYELQMPLTPGGKIDREFWAKHHPRSGFRRFWAGEEETGELRHGHEGWKLAFAGGIGQDEVIFRAEDHRFAVGEYVSIKERDGVTRTFHIAAID